MLPEWTITPTIRGRKLVVTKNGHMGLAPFWVEKGDKLAILFGCSLPVVMTDCGGHYHLKGDCFCAGEDLEEILEGLPGI
jgi:hypothetical protein